MALAAPTTQELADDIIAQLEASISQTIPILPKSFSRVLAKVLAGAVVLVYKYAGFLLLQLFVAHASFRETTVLGKVIIPLVELGRLFGVGDPIAGTRAELVIDVTVTNQIGTLPSGSQLLRSDTGVIYLTKAAVALDAATVQVTVVASSDPDENGGAGTIGNLDPGDILSFANPLDNVARDAVVDSQAVTGADAETEAAYRQRIIDRVQARPQGGAYSDYRVWAKTVPGIVSVYPYTSPSPGEVDVYVEATEASSGDPDGIPTGAQITAVFDAIQLDTGGLASRRPVGAAVNVYGITRLAFDVEVTGLSIDASLEAEVKAAISSGIDEYLRTREPYIIGLSVLPRRDRVTVAAVGGIVNGIVEVAGGTVVSVALELGAIPIAGYTLGDGEKAKGGGVSYA
jgi:uncharacterized phage protein gp47/JayE